MDVKELKGHLSTAVLSEWTVTELKEGAYPYLNSKTGVVSLSFAVYGRVSNAFGANHTVVLAVCKNEDSADTLVAGEPLEYYLSCGDKFIETGGLDRAAAKDRCTEALKTSKAHASVAASMLGLHGTQPVSDGCIFWRDYRRSQTICEHTGAFLAQLQQSRPNFLEEMTAGLELAQSSIASSAEVASETLSLTELAFRVPVLIEGDRGAGKTVEARAFARDNGYARVELGGHEGVEALDLLGYSLLAPSGAMVWKDGALSEAFRRAKTEKVVLIVDEMLRIRVRELSIFLTALSPDKGVYRIRTGRIVDVVDGVAREEELECPCENLCIIATTNVGAEYSVDEVDPALAERFVVLRKDTTEEALRRILREESNARGFAVTLAPSLVKFYLKMVEARNRGLVARTPTTRTLVRAIAIAPTEEDVIRVLRTQILLWVARTSEGLPVPEQIETAEALLTRFVG